MDNSTLATVHRFIHAYELLNDALDKMYQWAAQRPHNPRSYLIPLYWTDTCQEALALWHIRHLKAVPRELWWREWAALQTVGVYIDYPHKQHLIDLHNRWKMAGHDVCAQLERRKQKHEAV